VGTAFANIILQSGLSSTIALFGFPSMNKTEMCTICGISGLLQVGCILMLKWELEKEEMDAKGRAASIVDRTGSLTGSFNGGGRPASASLASHTGSVADEMGDDLDEVAAYNYQQQADRDVAAAMQMMGSFSNEEGGDRSAGEEGGVRNRQSSMFTSLAQNSAMQKVLQ
jgi:hypothetical protein